MFRSLTAVVMVAVTVSCSEKKQLTEMHDATVSMDNRTEVLNQKTNLLKEDSHRLMELSAELYDALRQGDAVKIRHSSWEAAIKADRLEEKLVQSALYFMSFEFQLWNSLGQDESLEKRERLLQQATMEFLLKVEGLSPRGDEINPLATPLRFDIGNFGEVFGDMNRTATFNAMSAVLHRMNRKQTENLVRLNMEQYSVNMLDLIEKSLLMKQQIEKENLMNSVVPDYVKEVLAHENTAIQLLQTRVSFLATMWMMKASELQNKGMLQQIRGVYFDNLLKKEWSFDISKMNAVQLHYYRTEVLEQALRTKLFLNKLGIEAVKNKQIQSMYARMKIINVSKTESIPLKQEQQLFLRSMKQLYGNSNKE